MNNRGRGGDGAHFGGDYSYGDYFRDKVVKLQNQVCVLIATLM